MFKEVNMDKDELKKFLAWTHSSPVRPSIFKDVLFIKATGDYFS